MTDNDERREYTRHPLRVFAELDNSNEKCAAHVLDISAQGARIALLDENNFAAGDTVRFNIELPADRNPEGIPVYLHLNGIIAHRHQHILGIFYQPASDLDAELLQYLLNNFE
ncbi:MAG: PilZ domain-containing protein [Pseudomonadota bacterium]